MSDSEKKVDNGVNVEAVLGAREALSGAREGAKFKWRARSEWIRGTHSRASVDEYFGLGQEQRHKSTFTFELDHPELFASEDHGATPVEHVLAALAGCLTGGIAAIAQNRKIQLRSVKATLEGDMDLCGILGIDRSVRNGFSEVRVKFEIDADATAEEIRALVEQSRKRSAVYDALSNPTRVVVEVA